MTRAPSTAYSKLSQLGVAALLRSLLRARKAP